MSEQEKKSNPELFSLQELSEEIVSEIVNQPCENIDQFIKNVNDIARSQKDPDKQNKIYTFFYNLLLHFLIAIIVQPFASTIDFNIKKALSKYGKKEICRTINETVMASVDSRDILNQLRYVKINKGHLNVRLSPKMTGKVIGKLYLGNLVEIINKRNKWRKIRWVDASGEASIEGWVFSKHLEKFK